MWETDTAETDISALDTSYAPTRPLSSRLRRLGLATRWARLRHRLAAGIMLPIRWRLVLILFGLLAVLLGSLGTLVTVTEEHTLFQNEATTLRSQARTVKKIFTYYPIAPAPGGTISPVDANTEQMRFSAIITRLANGNVRASIFSPDGLLLLSGDRELVPLVSPTPEVLSQSMIPQGNPDYLLMDGDSQRQLVVMEPLTDFGTVVGILVLSTPTEPFDKSIAMTRLALAVGIVLSLGLAAIFTWPLVGAALHPLTQMERTSTRIARGDLSLRLEEPPTTDEIGRLARSFNYMVAELDAAFTRQKRFVADASHELRTPLTALRGSLEMQLIGAAAEDPEAARRLVRGMYAETRRMQRLVDDLLMLTRIDDHRLELHPEVIDLPSLITELADVAASLATSQAIVTEIPELLPELRTDPDRLRQILLNLVSNAVKFTPADGTVTISVAPDATRGGVVFTVQDTGMGIDPAALPFVFDRFYRADPARVRSAVQPGGSGLGLAIAHGLVVALGGTIALASVVGTGTTATVWFPGQPPG